jgi:hypothetical protein
MNGGQELGPAVAHDRSTQCLCRRAHRSKRDGLAWGGQALRPILGGRCGLPAICPDANRHSTGRGRDTAHAHHGGSRNVVGGWSGCCSRCRGWRCWCGSDSWRRQWPPRRHGKRCRGGSRHGAIPSSALRRLVYAMHVCQGESSPGDTIRTPVQLCAATPRHATAPWCWGGTSHGRATTALRRTRGLCPRRPQALTVARVCCLTPHHHLSFISRPRRLPYAGIGVVHLSPSGGFRPRRWASATVTQANGLPRRQRTLRRSKGISGMSAHRLHGGGVNVQTSPWHVSVISGRRGRRGVTAPPG